jgi:hypothetical protein
MKLNALMVKKIQDSFERSKSKINLNWFEKFKPIQVVILK